MRHSVLKEMMYGDLQDAYETRPPERLQKDSLEAYEKLENALTKEQKKLLDEFLDRDMDECVAREDYILRLAFRSGYLLGAEVFGEDRPVRGRDLRPICVRFSSVLCPSARFAPAAGVFSCLSRRNMIQ